MSDTCLESFFAATETTVSDIEEAGWRMYGSSGGGWWWVEKGSRERQMVPRWIHELMSQAREDGAEYVRRKIRDALNVPQLEMKPRPVRGNP